MSTRASASEEAVRADKPPVGPTASFAGGTTSTEAELQKGYVVNVEAIKQAAVRKGLFSTHAIARATKIHRPAVAALLRGELVSLRICKKLAEGLGVDWPEGVLTKREAA